MFEHFDTPRTYGSPHEFSCPPGPTPYESALDDLVGNEGSEVMSACWAIASRRSLTRLTKPSTHTKQNSKPLRRFSMAPATEALTPWGEKDDPFEDAICIAKREEGERLCDALDEIQIFAHDDIRHETFDLTLS